MHPLCFSFHLQSPRAHACAGDLLRKPLLQSRPRRADTTRHLCSCRATLTKANNKYTARQSDSHKLSTAHTAKPKNDLVHFESLKLQQHDPNSGAKLDLIVAGAGPSGIAVAERVSAAGYKVCVVDPAPLAHWPNNYGVWVDEFEAMGLDDCLEIIWDKAKVHLDSNIER